MKELEIKKLANEGNKEGCAILAKQLLQIRKQKTRTYAANSKIQSVSTQSKAMGANVKLASAMGTTSKVLGDMNKIMRPEKIAADAHRFSEATARLEFTDEMINDTMDDILADSGDEEESDRIISQVLDEIGIETSGKMRSAPTPALSNPVSTDVDIDILAKLEKLKS